MKKLPLLLIPVMFAAAALLFASSAHAQPPDPHGHDQTPATVTGHITVTGQITNATTGGTLPITTAIMLHGYDGNSMTLMEPGVADAQGRFRFENVEVAQDRIFEVMANFGDATYFSSAAKVESNESALDAPVTVYDMSNDVSHASIDQLHTFLEVIGKWLRVTEVYILSNDSDHAIGNVFQADDGTPVTLRFSLPAGTSNVEFDDGSNTQRYIQTKDGFLDTAVLVPGKSSAQVVVSYVLPYDGKARVEHALNYKARGANVVIPDLGLQVTSSQLQPQGKQQANDGTWVQVYTSGELGPSFSFEVSGQPQNASPTLMNTQAPKNNSQPMLMASLALGLVLIAGGLVWWWKSGNSQASQVVELDFDEQREALIQAMADLDDAYEAGTLTEAERDQQRAGLRAELLALLQEGPAPAAESVEP